MDKYLLMIAGSDIDTFYEVEDFITSGDVTMAKPLGQKVGGCVLNVATVAAAKGLKVKVLDYLKQDDEGTNLLINTLVEKGVDVSEIKYGKDVVNGNCLIMQCKDEKCIYVIDPVRPYFTVDDKMQEMLNNAKYIYTLMHMVKSSFETIEPLIEAKKHGAKIFFDGASQYKNKDEIDILLKLADGLFINTKAYERLCEAANFDVKEELLNNGALFVCITDGGNGATCYTKEKAYFHPAIKIDVVDSTGAGDSFAGCFLSFLAEGNDIETCLHYASINGAYACCKLGGMAGAVSREELENFYNK